MPRRLVNSIGVKVNQYKQRVHSFLGHSHRWRTTRAQVAEFIKMQPTPAPSSPPRSPEPVTQETVYPAPPQNRGSAPFSVLGGLFTKLSTERKPERRRRLLNAWFNVCC